MTAPTLPGRVVDRNHTGWMLTRDGHGTDVYTIKHVGGYMTRTRSPSSTAGSARSSA